MIRLVNFIISSCIECGAPFFFDSPPTPLKSLETCYNSAIRLATGLPIWTPLPVLRREAGVSSIFIRLCYLIRLFLVLFISILSSPSDLRLGKKARSALMIPSVSWKWCHPLQELSDTENQSCKKPWTYNQMDLAYRLFNISWDGSSHRGESWERFK